MKKAINKRKNENSKYLNYGVPSDFADVLEKSKLSISEINKSKTVILKRKFKLDETQVEFIKHCLKREPIKNNVLEKLLINSNFICCICKGVKSTSYIIHHIKKYSSSKDNNYANLAVLCPDDHDLAHREGISLTRKITVTQIKTAKKSWEKEVLEYNRKNAKTPRTTTQWSEIAIKMANFLRDHLFEAHRGALMFDVNTTAVFGNDGYTSDLTKNELKKFRKYLDKNGLKEVGFGVCKENYTWCLLVDSKKVNELNNAIWECFPFGGSNNPTQKKAGYLTLWTYFDKPLSQYIHY